MDRTEEALLRGSRREAANKLLQTICIGRFDQPNTA
jgi:hypothetical protein